MKKIIPIANLATRLSTINRAVRYENGHFENDAEHSFQLALVCWATNKQYNLDLNDELLLKLALIHDLVEVYAGDTDAFGDKKDLDSKKEREEKALRKIKEEHPDFSEMSEVIERYERKKDVEAQLVFVLDKILADINIYQNKSDYYKDKKITIDAWKKWLFNKIDIESLDSKLKPLIKEFINEVETKHGEVFYRD
ncbi:HD domain-containing protein [Patescibacteria group bacterium]|nr:HD domain-containing protein [Patescibacteria group bacterium]